MYFLSAYSYFLPVCLNYFAPMDTGMYVLSIERRIAILHSMVVRDRQIAAFY